MSCHFLRPACGWRCFPIGSANLVHDEALLAIHELQATQTLLCFFPNYSPREEKSIVTELPVLEIKSQSVEDWYRLNASEEDKFHFFFCGTLDLCRGMVVDVCAGDPVISGSDDPIYDIYKWDLESVPPIEERG